MFYLMKPNFLNRVDVISEILLPFIPSTCQPIFLKMEGKNSNNFKNSDKGNKEALALKCLIILINILVKTYDLCQGNCHGLSCIITNNSAAHLFCVYCSASHWEIGYNVTWLSKILSWRSMKINAQYIKLMGHFESRAKRKAHSTKCPHIKLGEISHKRLNSTSENSRTKKKKK